MSTQNECEINKVSEKTSIQEVAKILAESRCVGPVLVTKINSDEVVGIIDMRSIIKAVASDEFNNKQESFTIMSNKLVNLSDNNNLSELISHLRSLDDKLDTYRPIIENGKRIGGMYIIR